MGEESEGSRNGGTGMVGGIVNKERKRKRKFNEGIGMKNGNKNTSGVY